jgi:hypothetical protein
MKHWLAVSFLLALSPLAQAHQSLPETYFSMPCYLASDDDRWTFRDFGFTLSYTDAQGKKQTLTASSKNNPKNCTEKSVTVKAKVPAGTLKIHIDDFLGELSSTVECTNTIKQKFRKADIGKNCQLLVKSPKLGSYTTSGDCAIEMTCD